MTIPLESDSKETGTSPRSAVAGGSHILSVVENHTGGFALVQGGAADEIQFATADSSAPTGDSIFETGLGLGSSGGPNPEARVGLSSSSSSSSHLGSKIKFSVDNQAGGASRFIMQVTNSAGRSSAISILNFTGSGGVFPPTITMTSLDPAVVTNWIIGAGNPLEEKVGFFGKVPVVKQPVPVTLSDVISLLQAYGFCL